MLGVVALSLSSGNSSAPAYNIFHILFGFAGLVIVLTGVGHASSIFNLAFGAIEVYQAVADGAGWFPQQLFAWRPLDTQLHWVAGVLLAAIGAYGMLRRTRASVLLPKGS